jgi:hypothetical protein
METLGFVVGTPFYNKMNRQFFSKPTFEAVESSAFDFEANLWSKLREAAELERHESHFLLQCTVKSESLDVSVTPSFLLSSSEKRGIASAKHRRHKELHKEDMKKYRAASKERTLNRRKAHCVPEYCETVPEAKHRRLRHKTVYQFARPFINKAHHIYRLYGESYDFRLGEIDKLRSIPFEDLRMTPLCNDREYDIFKILYETADERISFYYLVMAYLFFTGVVVRLVEDLPELENVPLPDIKPEGDFEEKSPTHFEEESFLEEIRQIDMACMDPEFEEKRYDPPQHKPRRRKSVRFPRRKESLEETKDYSPDLSHAIPAEKSPISLLLTDHVDLRQAVIEMTSMMYTKWSNHSWTIEVGAKASEELYLFLDVEETVRSWNTKKHIDLCIDDIQVKLARYTAQKSFFATILYYRLVVLIDELFQITELNRIGTISSASLNELADVHVQFGMYQDKHPNEFRSQMSNAFDSAMVLYLDVVEKYVENLKLKQQFAKYGDMARKPKSVKDAIELAGIRVKARYDQIRNGIFDSIESKIPSKFKKARASLAGMFKTFYEQLDDIYLKYPCIKDILDVGEFAMVLYSLCYHKHTAGSAFVLVYSFARIHFGRLMSGTIAGMCSALVKAFMEHPVQIKEEGLEESLQWASRSIDYVITSPLAQAISKFIAALCAWKTFPKEVALRIYQYIDKPKENLNIPTVIQMSLDLFAKLVRVTRLLWEGNGLSKALFEDDPLAAAIAQTADLMLWKDKLYDGREVVGSKSQTEFYQEAAGLLQLFQSYREKHRPGTPQYSTIQRHYMTLLSAVTDINLKISGGHRRTPMFIVVAGRPNIGKSTILNYINFLMAEVMGIEYKPEMVYHRIVTSEYWETYNPVSQPFIHYSELGNIHRNIAGKVGDPAVTELTSVVDSVPFPVNVAFEGKGKVFCIPELVSADTNNGELNLGVIVNNPAAYWRRIIMVTPEPLQEVLNAEGGIDSEKIAALPRELEGWKFSVTHYAAVNSVKATPVIDMKSGSVDEFTDLMKGKMRAHIKNQTIMIKSRTNDKMRGYGTQPAVALEETRAVIADKLERLMNDLNEPEAPVKAEAIKTIGEADVGGLRPFYQEDMDQQREIKQNFENVLQKAIKEKDVSQQVYFTKLSAAISDVTWDTIAHWKVKALASFLLPRVRDLLVCSIVFLWWFRVIAFTHMVLLLALIFSHNWGTAETLKTSGRHAFLQELRTKLERSKQRMNQFLGDKPNFAPAMYTSLVVAIPVLVAVLYLVFKKDKEDKEVETSKPVEVPVVHIRPEATSTFVHETDTTARIRALEESIQAGNVITRIKNEQLSVWNDKIERSPNVHTGDLKSLSQCVNHNVHQVALLQDTSRLKTHITGICGNFALINSHVLKKFKFPVKLRIYNAPGDETAYRESQIREKDCVHLGNDVTVIRVSSRQFKDILKHFTANTNLPGVAECMIDNCYVTGSRAINIDINGGKEPNIVEFAYQYNWSKHTYGSCGTPLLMKIGNGCSLVGLHCAGAVDESIGISFAGTVVREKIAAALKVLENDILMPLKSESSEMMRCEFPIAKSPFVHENFHNLDYYGKLPGPVTITNKSKLKPSIFQKRGFLEELFYNTVGHVRSTVFVPPVMMPTVIDGTWTSPYNLALRELNTVKPALDRDVLSRVIKEIVDRVVTGLRENGIPELKPLTLEEAVNGVEEDPFIRRINASTAAGFGFTGKKRDHFHYPNGDFSKAEPTEEVLKEVEKLINAYDKGETPQVVYKAQLKDEPRDRQKVAKGKTRVFYSASLPSLIVGRMFLGPIFSTMVSHSKLYCAALGIDMHTQFDGMMKSMREFSEESIEQDYEKFDQKMAFDIGWGSASTVYAIAKDMGYNERALRILQGILTSNLFPLILMNMDLFCAVAAQPSGKPYTAEDNTLRGLIMMMYLWYINESTKDLDFFKHMFPNLYGDDLVAPTKVPKLFNNVIYAKLVREHLGMGTTPARKGEQFVEIIPTIETSFLKRTARFKPDLNKLVATLEMDSIYKSLEWMLPSDAVTDLEQITSTVSSALREMFFHVEEPQYTAFADGLKERLVQGYSWAETDHISPCILKYDDLLEYYKTKCE